MPTSAETTDFALDYDSPPVAEVEIEDVQYRVDAGFRGAIAVSSRSVGTWTYSLLGEGKWDGVRLKVKSLERSVLTTLEKALREASRGGE